MVFFNEIWISLILPTNLLIKNDALNHIYSMLEYFKDEEFKLEQRNFGSIRQLLNDYIDISNPIKSNARDINNLGNSLTALII